MTLTIEVKNSNPTSVLYDANKKTKVVSLPEDLILFQIITQVPAKSVIRFKCVSKQWNSFLTKDRFKQMHDLNLLKHPHLEDKSLLFLSQFQRTFFTMDCESLPNKAPCPRPLPQFVASRPRYMSILTSYHGLVCLRITTYDYQDDAYIILWNPLTTDYKMLSKPSNPEHIECYMSSKSGYGLYHGSCEDDYKLLVVTQSGNNVYIYSLKSDSWRKLNKKSPFNIYWARGIYWEENLYFVLYNAKKSLMRFDTKAERFHTIEIPLEYDNRHYPQIATTVHKGCIHLCVKYVIYEQTHCVKRTCMEVWKFNADRNILIKVVTYQLRSNDDIDCMFPLYLMSNGNWLMQECRGCRICEVELRMKYSEDKDSHDEYKLCYFDIVDYPQKVKYTETFVSPNRYMK